MKIRFTILLVAILCCGITGPVAGYDASITNCTPVPGGIKLEWIPGGEAVVKWSPDLGTPFTDLSATLPAGQGSYTDSVHGSDAQCFYRVEVLSPGGMVLIPAGSNSGTNPLGTGESYDEYYPATYSLSVSAFYMDATEISKAQWDTVYSWAIAHDYEFDHTGSGKASDHPVHNVNWYDCVKWCNARSQMEGRTPCYTVGGSTYKIGQSAPVCNFSASGYRLPTSAEWEYAARGGLNSKRFPWGDTIQHPKANYESRVDESYDTSLTSGYHPDYDEGEHPYTSPAGSFAANGYGLYDMAGNVWELCNDWHPNNVGSYRVYRGGSWESSAINQRCAGAFGYSPGVALTRLGFRTVRSAD